MVGITCGERTGVVKCIGILNAYLSQEHILCIKLFKNGVNWELGIYEVVLKW
jgi:hypothetical protein